ncbi:MAG: cell wall hydrolase [Lachnospiraceae bacterium]|nr:cell wall hydrolase [Lachnospiraceae bacterium]
MYKLRSSKTVALILSVTMFFSILPSFSSYAETTKEKLEKAQQQHEETKKNLHETKENIEDLNDVKDSLQGELAQLNDQLEEVSENLADLEKQIDDKKSEIEQTQADLEVAKQAEADQYAAMKKRIQFMYEKQDFMFTEMVFSAKSFADLLNKNGYIESLSAYDKKMKDELEQTRMNIEDTEARLLSEKEELDGLHEQVVAEQQKVTVYVAATSSNIKKYSKEIKAAEAVAAAFEVQAAQEASDIEALKKQLAEEIRLSKLAAQSKWRDISEVSFEEGDRYLLANLIYCEAGNQPYEGQVAVGAVVINRVLSSVYPDTVVGVIYQNKQFSPVGSGRLALALAEDRATQACYNAADAAMSGQTNVGTCVYFRTPIEGLSGIQIGGHIFY